MRQQPDQLVPGVTVLGNLAIDVIDGAPQSAGGCASFAGVALEATRSLGTHSRIVALGAPRDHALFAGLTQRFGDLVRVLPSDRTSGFRLDYDDVDHRRVSVDAIGPVWTARDVDAADPRTTWVHLAPLLRTDFPADTLAHLAARGHQVSYDGQGLVRADRVGPLQVNRSFEPGLLEHVSVLKLAEDEAVVVAGADSEADVQADFDAAAAARLGVPEILVTYGSAGCDIYAGGAVERVPAAWRVAGVQTTGAGDMFTTCYVAHRAAGFDAGQAAKAASALVASELERRPQIGVAHRV